MEVTVLGDINLDIITSPIKRYPKKDQQLDLSNFIVQLGGSSAIFASACSRLGIKTKFIGRLGKDPISEFLINEIEKLGIVNKIRRVKGERSGITISLTFEDMKRAMITFKGSNENLSIKDFALKEIEGELIHIGGFNLLESLRKDVYKIFKFAKKKGIKTSLDPNWDPKGWTKKRLKDLKKILKITDFLFPDYEEGKAITKLRNERKIVKNLIELGVRVVALKCGKKGCWVGEDGKIFYVKGFKVKSIQTTGAGDVFNAGFIKAYFSGRGIKECGKWGNAAGALSTTNIGLERFPTQRKIRKLIEGFK